MKQHVNISVEQAWIEQAKEKDLNISELTEDAIQAALKKIEVIIDTSVEKCDFCGKKGAKETPDDIEREANTNEPVKHPTLLTWLWPDERWICNACLRLEGRKIPASVA